MKRAYDDDLRSFGSFCAIGVGLEVGKAWAKRGIFGADGSEHSDDGKRNYAAFRDYYGASTTLTKRIFSHNDDGASFTEIARLLRSEWGL